MVFWTITEPKDSTSGDFFSPRKTEGATVGTKGAPICVGARPCADDVWTFAGIATGAGRGDPRNALRALVKKLVVVPITFH